MNPKSILAIVIRLFAIYVMLMTLQMLALALGYIKNNASGASPILFVAPVVVFVIGFILWRFPLSIAGKIIPSNLLEEPVVNFSPRSVAAAASGIFGLWVVLSAFPHVVAYIGMQLYYPGQGSFLISEQFFASVFQAVCGLFLLAKPWFFALKIFPTENSEAESRF